MLSIKNKWAVHDRGLQTCWTSTLYCSWTCFSWWPNVGSRKDTVSAPFFNRLFHLHIDWSVEKRCRVCIWLLLFLSKWLPDCRMLCTHHYSPLVSRSWSILRRDTKPGIIFRWCRGVTWAGTLITCLTVPPNFFPRISHIISRLFPPQWFVRWVLGSITPRAQVWEQGLVTQILNMEVIGNRVLPLHTELGMIFSGRLLVAHPG